MTVLKKPITWIAIITIVTILLVLAIYKPRQATSTNALQYDSSAQTPATTIPSTIDVQVGQAEDQSHKLMSRSISSYSATELASLPIDKKMAYRVVVSRPVTQAQVQPLAEAVIDRLTKEDPEIDEITLWLYSDKSFVNGKQKMYQSGGQKVYHFKSLKPRRQKIRRNGCRKAV